MRIRTVAAAMAAALVTAGVFAASAAAEPVSVPLLAPGYPVYPMNSSQTETVSCTAGFVVYNQRGTPMMLTVGHCDQGGPVAVQYRSTGDMEAVGAYFVNLYSEPFTAEVRDIGVVNLKHSSVPVSKDLLDRTPISGWDRPQLGQRLCKIGAMSGMSCGIVTEVNYHKVWFTAYNQKGDSGGPVYRENGDGTVTAIGVSSGMPDDSVRCDTNLLGKNICGGTTMAELIAPSMEKWGLRLG